MGFADRLLFRPRLWRIAWRVRRSLSADIILLGAQRDEETPAGYLLTYLKDNYGLPKPEGWIVVNYLIARYGL